MNTFLSGTKQWIFQRVSNLLIVISSIVLAVIILNNTITNYESLLSLLSKPWLKFIITASLVVFSLNSMLAAWQIAGDYIKSPLVNKLFNIACMALTTLTLLLGIYMLWL